MPNIGDRVTIHYTGRLEDGSVFDSSRDGEPFEFVVGGRQVIAGLDRAILEMQEGEARTVTLPPEEAYGDATPGLAQEVDRAQLPDGVNEGDALHARLNNQDMIVWVRDVTADSAVVDANHPLAGKTLVFDVELLSVTAEA